MVLSQALNYLGFSFLGCKMNMLWSHFWFWDLKWNEQSWSLASGDEIVPSALSPGPERGLGWRVGGRAGSLFWPHSPPAPCTVSGTNMQFSCKCKAPWLFPTYYRWEIHASNRLNNSFITASNLWNWDSRFVAFDSTKSELVSADSQWPFPSALRSLAVWHLEWR